MRRILPLASAVALSVLASSGTATAVSPPDGAHDPHAALPVGPPVHPLRRTPSRQLALSNNPRLRALAERWGGSWAWRFDEDTGRPHSAALPGISFSDAEDLAADLARTLAVGPHALVLEPVAERQVGERWAMTFAQTHDGVLMFGTELALFAQSGRIHGVRTALFDPPSASAPPGTELWWPERDGGKLTWWPATRSEADDIVTIREVGTGDVLHRWTTRHHATVELEHDERKPGDAVVESALADGKIEDASGVSYTDAAGVHSGTDPYPLTLAGERLRMVDFARGRTTPVFEDLEGDVLLTADGDLTWAAADTWKHTKVVEAWLEAREPDHALLDIQVEANVNRTDFRCNAYYTGGTINFAARYGSCANTGRLGDVIYHEYGHGVHHYGLLAGGFAGDLSEGTADYISASILDDPQVGVGFFSDSRFLRDISIDRIYPDNSNGQVHNDGRIWGSFLWNLREAWQQTYGEELGATRVDELMLRAMSQGPSLTTVGDAVILADDDDGDLSNGTPHACELQELLDQHGLGPGPIGVIRIDHDPIVRAGSYDPSYPVDFALYDAMPDCSGLDGDTVALWWTADEITAEDAEDAFSTPGEEGDVPAAGPEYTSAGGATWHRLDLTVDGSAYDGAIPRQLATTRVSYFIEARSLDGTERVTTHEGVLDRVYRFRVGDLEAVWCEDFEDVDTLFDPNAPADGTDDTDEPGVDGGWEASAGTPWEEPRDSWESQWAVGTPEEALWNPDGAASGERIVATNLAGNYLNRNVQYLRSPPIPIPAEGRMPLLAFSRWLTVEDAEYDKARIYLDDERIWEQPRTASGGQHTLDSGWTLFELDADDLQGSEVRLTWTLRSDAGLEFGGWALDDICVYRLDDLPGHHRIRDLELSIDDADVVTASWTQPWIAPLDEVVLVRTRGGLPTSRTDGLWVHLDQAPEPGTAALAMDAETEPCTTYGYAVLVRADGVWYEQVVEGDNGALIATSCPDRPPVDPPDPVDPTPDGPVGAVDSWQLPDVGCGCQTTTLGPASAAWMMLLGLLLLRRRTR